jgi:maltose O-acetyltransferase
MWSGIAQVGIITHAYESVLHYLADWEFHFSRAPTPNLFRRLYLAFMRVRHGRNISLGTQFYLRNRGNLVVGEWCAFGSFARIWNYAPIDIGDDFLSAGGLTLNSATHDPITLNPVGKPITIGNRVWCGVNVTILAGVSIGNDVVIGAGSVVVSDIPANSVAGGVPARKIRDLDRMPEQLLWRWADRLSHRTSGT